MNKMSAVITTTNNSRRSHESSCRSVVLICLLSLFCLTLSNSYVKFTTATSSFFPHYLSSTLRGSSPSPSPSSRHLSVPTASPEGLQPPGDDAISSVLFNPIPLVLAYQPKHFEIDPPDTAQSVGPLALSLPTLDPNVRVVVTLLSNRETRTPFIESVAKSPLFLADFQKLEGDLVMGHEGATSTGVTVGLVHTNGTVLRQFNATSTQSSVKIFDSLIRAPGSQGPWLLADIFPFSGDDFVDVFAVLNNTAALRLETVQEPFTPGGVGSVRTADFREFSADNNLTFVGLFQSFFGDQIKFKEEDLVIQVKRGTTANGEDVVEAVNEWPIYQFKIPGGTSAGFPRWNLTTLFTEQKAITLIDNAHRQFRKGRLGEILIDNSDQHPIY
eukprot:GHVS01094575.1.p1 GENE.GHVS01094575.1~~GHVS01094575.1.p1  ORF type:complete len:386 (-),score=79.87 GHVS01094575.1:101-1258(-)